MEKIKEDLIADLHFLMGLVIEKKARSFPEVHRERTRSKGHKLHQPNLTKQFFITREVKCWNRLPREPVEAPSSGYFQAQLGKVTSTLTQL